MIDFKKFDWRSLQRFLSPQATADLNAFLERLPANAGQTILMAAGIAWASAGALGLYTTIEAQKLTEIRAQLQEAKALKPPVPEILDVPVPKAEVDNFVKTAQEIYKGVDIKANGSSVSITTKSTAGYAEFREAIGHVQNGGQGWRVNVDKLCVGRECKSFPLAAALKINKVSVNMPVQSQ